MSQEELNSYRLTSMDEPTDEMLTAIMREAAAEATRKKELAEKRLFEDLRCMIDQRQKEVEALQWLQQVHRQCDGGDADCRPRLFL